MLHYICYMTTELFFFFNLYVRYKNDVIIIIIFLVFVIIVLSIRNLPMVYREYPLPAATSDLGIHCLPMSHKKNTILCVLMKAVSTILQRCRLYRVCWRMITHVPKGRPFLSIQYAHGDLCKHLGIDDRYSNLFLNAYINRHAHTEYFKMV